MNEQYAALRGLIFQTGAICFVFLIVALFFRYRRTAIFLSFSILILLGILALGGNMFRTYYNDDGHRLLIKVDGHYRVYDVTTKKASTMLLKRGDEIDNPGFVAFQSGNGAVDILKICFTRGGPCAVIDAMPTK